MHHRVILVVLAIDDLVVLAIDDLVVLAIDDLVVLAIDELVVLAIRSKFWMSTFQPRRRFDWSKTWPIGMSNLFLLGLVDIPPFFLGSSCLVAGWTGIRIRNNRVSESNPE